MSEFWNTRYAAEEYVYGREPNAFFKDFLQGKSPGKLLLPCEGEGRNAVYAASLGWEVYAFDQSSSGQEKAMKLAKEAGVSIQYEIADANSYESTEKFDLIAFLWAHFDQQTRKVFHKRMTGYLKEGGMLVLESFNKKQINFSSGGPKDPAMLPSVEDLKEDFNSLQLLYLAEEQTTISEGAFHEGIAEVIRYIGIK